MSTDSVLAEIVLRKAFFDMTKGASLDFVKESAKSHLDSMVRGAFSSDQQLPVMNGQELLIRGGIKVAQKFYEVYTEKNEEVGQKRLSFDREVISHIATMLVRQNIESIHYSNEEKLFQQFINLFHENGVESEVFPYLGIKKSRVRDDSIGVDGDFYSVSEFYEMSRMIEQPLVSDLPSAKTCRAISLFFRTQLRIFLDEIYNEFKARWRVFDVIRALRKGKTFLYGLMVRRFIIISLSNLLWSLQYPVDTESGYSLGLDKKISLCTISLTLINRLLDKKHEPDISKLGPDNSLMNFVRQVEIYLRELSDSFEEEKLKSLNMKEITSKSQATARVLNENIFKLIYKKEGNTEYLANQVYYLNLLLKNNKEIASEFSKFDIQSSEKNNPPKTVIDVLIVFSHLSSKQRERIVNKLSRSKFTSKQAFGRTLKEIDETFIEPIAESCLKAIEEGNLSAKASEIDKVAALRFLPLLSLVVLDYRVEVDYDETSRSKRIAKKNETEFHTGHEQIETISRIAYGNERNLADRYTWDLSPYLQLHKKIIQHINQLPRRQYKLGQLTTLLDSLQAFISQYKTFLLYPKFKEFVIESLNLISIEFSSLKRTLDELDDKIKADTNEDRSVVDTIRTMDQSLMSKIDVFKTSIDNLNSKVNSADFEDNLKEDMISRLSELKEKFSDAFGRQQLGMVSILEEASPILKKKTMMTGSFRENSATPLEEEPDEAECKPREIIALTNLVNKCLWNLSSQSQYSKKGQLLRQLLHDLSKKKTVKKEDARKIISELARVTCAYQRNLFLFHKEYANTRSGNILITEINRSISNQRLPTAELLFGKAGLDRAKHYPDRRAWCQDELSKLRKHKNWSKEADDLRPISRRL